MVNDEFDNMDIHFMKLAIGQAKKAAKINEVPIGCVSCMMVRLLAEDITDVIPTRLHLDTLR